MATGDESPRSISVCSGIWMLHMLCMTERTARVKGWACHWSSMNLASGNVATEGRRQSPKNSAGSRVERKMT
eukprot:6174300-Pleurochrysis_carterae.AAC.1